MNFVYILECSDKSLYTGWTNDLKKRIASHNCGKGAKYTKGRTPVRLVYFEIVENKNKALSRENHIKKLSKKQKLWLIKNFNFKKYDIFLNECYTYDKKYKIILSEYQDKVHTTAAGVRRISQNLEISPDEVMQFCLQIINSPDSMVYSKGKNYYVVGFEGILTINKSSFTIITAKKY